MADNDTSVLPSPSPEHRRIAAANFDRANQVIASGNHDYGIQLLLTCCKLDPANLTFRQALRRTERAKYKNNLRGSRMAGLTSSPTKAKILAAKKTRNYLKILEHTEEVLTANPWDIGAQMDQAEAAEALGLFDLAVWTLEQARQKDLSHAPVNRALARLHEKLGNLIQAINHWQMVYKADPADIEAHHRAKDLAASETITRGNYEEALGGESMTRPSIPKAAKSDEGPTNPLEREVQAIRQRIATAPTRAAGYLQLAAVYRRDNLLDQARTILQEGLGPTGNDFQLTFELAELDLEPFRQNLALAEKKFKSDPKNEDLRKLRHRLKKEINSRELELYRAKAERYPTDLSHRFEVGRRLFKLGQLEEAIKELQAARGDQRVMWKSLWHLGRCFKGRNNWPLARRNFEEALQVLPPGEENTRKEILYQLATGCADNGDVSTALELGNELANLDFAFKDIGKLLDEWHARLQRA